MDFSSCCLSIGTTSCSISRSMLSYSDGFFPERKNKHIGNSLKRVNCSNNFTATGVFQRRTPLLYRTRCRRRKKGIDVLSEIRHLPEDMANFGVQDYQRIPLPRLCGYGLNTLLPGTRLSCWTLRSLQRLSIPSMQSELTELGNMQTRCDSHPNRFFPFPMSSKAAANTPDGTSCCKDVVSVQRQVATVQIANDITGAAQGLLQHLYTHMYLFLLA